MVMTVVTVSKVPPSLRGDLTKWMQEISTGVYVGNFNTRVREQLWERIKQNVGLGQATLSYASRNELGYQFETYQTQRQNVSFDGIPLVMIPKSEEESQGTLDRGFSKAAKYRKSRKFANKSKKGAKQTYVVIDIETDGLNSRENHIIEIASIKVKGEEKEIYQSFLQYPFELPKDIIELTGISQETLAEEGRDVKKVLVEFMNFIEDLPLVGYNLQFDIDFINNYLEAYDMHKLTNEKFDLLKYVKKEKMFLTSYKLVDVLPVYEIYDKLIHRALDDAYLTYELSTKVNEFNKNLDQKG